MSTDTLIGNIVDTTEEINGSISDTTTIGGKIDNVYLQGLSAYDIAVKNGYSGTENEWISYIQNKVGYAEYTDSYLLLYADSTKAVQIAKLLIEGGGSITGGISEAKCIQLIETYHDDTKQDILTTEDKQAIADLHQDPEVPTKVSELENDSGYVTSSYHDNTKQDVLTSEDKQAIADMHQDPDVPTKVSELENDSGYITSSYHDSTKQDILTTEDKQAIADMHQDPEVPTKVSELENDSGYITSSYHDSTKQDVLTSEDKQAIADMHQDPEVPTKLSELLDDESHRLVTDTEKDSWNAKTSFSGSYNDLTDKPSIPTVTNDFTNDYKSEVDTLWEDYKAALEVI